MGYSLLLSAQATADLEHLFDFLFDSYRSFGDTKAQAFDRAEQRITSTLEHIQSMSAVPHQGTLCSDIYPNLRCVTKDRAVIYFVSDQSTQQLSVFAIFYGGQNHRQHMLNRILDRPPLSELP